MSHGDRASSTDLPAAFTSTAQLSTENPSHSQKLSYDKSALSQVFVMYNLVVIVTIHVLEQGLLHIGGLLDTVCRHYPRLKDGLLLSTVSLANSQFFRLLLLLPLCFF